MAEVPTLKISRRSRAGLEAAFVLARLSESICPRDISSSLVASLASPMDKLPRSKGPIRVPWFPRPSQHHPSHNSSQKGMPLAMLLRLDVGKLSS